MKLIDVFEARLIGFSLSMLLALPCAAGAATIGDSLQRELSGIGPNETAEVIVSFEGDGPLTLEQLGVLEDLGITGVYFQALPIAGVLATRAQVEALDRHEGVRSLWLNEALEYENQNSTALTGVDKLRTDRNLRSGGLPASGRGIGVLVNDSGIDGQHPDLQYPEHVVQNVAAQTNLHAQDALLPITYVEDVPDTDLAVGHGTHVSGIIGGTGAAAAGGKYEGVAPGADLIGYGSGAGLFILDSIGGFDYALVNQSRYNIRVISNSFGNPSDTGTDFNPDDPTNIATKRLADRNIVVVFSAGNSGSGEGTITGNFKKAPWVIVAGAGDSRGLLADFSSRGKRNGGGQVVVDGETFTWFDRPAVVAPGVDVISTQAKSDALGTGDDLPPAEDLFYTIKSGTSMAAPHVSGVVALMLEANPALHWTEVREILEETATNMPGYEVFEVGAGYINAHAAVAAAKGVRDDYGLTLILGRDFNAGVNVSSEAGPAFDLFFTPVNTPAAQSDVETFVVPQGLATISASANVSENTVAIVLTDPDGNRFGSAISLPLLGPSIGVTAPARPGEWTIEIRGIGSVSGVALDPLGLGNGTAVPGTIHVDTSFIRIDGFFGLGDIAGHPAQGIIEQAVSRRLVDARSGGAYEPDAAIVRGELADYLTLGTGIRQFRPTDGSDSLSDAFGLTLAAAEAVTARGGPLRDLNHVQMATVKPAAPGIYDPAGTVSRAELAYSMVQALGLESIAEEIAAQLNGPITVAFKDERVPLEDDAEVPDALRGHVQLALDLQIMRAEFSLEQGPFELEPTIKARFHPLDAETRAGYAFAAVNWLDRFRQAE
ncbi:MAG: S8 family serine peptidase [Gammaproteobacteria bacterium]